MKLDVLSVRISAETKKWFLRWKKEQRKKRHFADVHITENVLKLGVEAWEEGDRIE